MTFKKSLICVLIATLGIFMYSIQPVHISGTSMYPTYHNGDYVLSTPCFELKDNDIIIVDTSNRKDFQTHYIVKRYKADKSSKDRIWLEGDNKAVSYDSRFVGTFERTRIKNKCLLNVSALFRKMIGES